MGKMKVNRFSGCFGGGKSTLLIELGQRGYATMEEPRRRIVKEEMLGAGLHSPPAHESGAPSGYVGQYSLVQAHWL
jgi:predicted ATPase